MSNVNSTLRCRATPVGNHWVRGLRSRRSTQKYRQLFCSAFNRCEPLAAEEESGLATPFASFCLCMAVNFSAYVKETDPGNLRHSIYQKKLKRCDFTHVAAANFVPS